MKAPWYKRIAWHQFRIPMLLALAVPILLLMEVNIDRLAKSVDQPLYYSSRLDEISKMDTEASRLFDIAERHAIGGSGVTSEDVNRALDMFWARVDSTKTPSYMKILGEGNVDPSLIFDLYQALPQFEAAVGALKSGEPDSYEPMRNLKFQYGDRLHDLNEIAWSIRRKVVVDFVAGNTQNIEILRNIQFGFVALCLFIVLYVMLELIVANRLNLSLNRMIAENRKLLRTDLLTGISNRSAFETALAEHCAAADTSGFSVVYFDLDGFKTINDTYGHAAGDALLRDAADIFRALFSDLDTISRFGGDEFAAIIPGSSGHAKRLVEAFIARIAEAPSLVRGAHVSSSAGLCHSSQVSGEDLPEALMRRADIALYSAKHNGRSRLVLFTDDLLEQRSREELAEALLPKAISDHEIKAAFQPIIDIRSGKVGYFEALVRWSPPQLGYVRPDVLVAIAERSGHIHDLTLLMMRRAIAMRARLLADGYDIPISVNLAPSLLQEAHFVNEVIELLDQEAVSPGALVMELVEYSELDDSELVTSNLDRLREKGISLAIDDFGKAYSNVHRLMQTEFKLLKLDKILLSNVGTNERAMQVLAGLNGLMETIHVEVVGEGIETEDQLQLLRISGIRYAQGFYFSRPLFADALMAFMRERYADDGKGKAVKALGG